MEEQKQEQGQTTPDPLAAWELPERLGQEKYTNADWGYLRTDGKTINGGY